MLLGTTRSRNKQSSVVGGAAAAAGSPAASAAASVAFRVATEVSFQTPPLRRNSAMNAGAAEIHAGLA